MGRLSKADIKPKRANDPVIDDILPKSGRVEGSVVQKS
jgi:hypothetical protein